MKKKNTTSSPHYKNLHIETFAKRFRPYLHSNIFACSPWILTLMKTSVTEDLIFIKICITFNSKYKKNIEMKNRSSQSENLVGKFSGYVRAQNTHNIFAFSQFYTLHLGAFSSSIFTILLAKIFRQKFSEQFRNIHFSF